VSKVSRFIPLQVSQQVENTACGQAEKKAEEQTGACAKELKRSCPADLLAKQDKFDGHVLAPVPVEGGNVPLLLDASLRGLETDLEIGDRVGG